MRLPIGSAFILPIAFAASCSAPLSPRPPAAFAPAEELPAPAPAAVQRPLPDPAAAGPLTLPEALALALLRSPRLQAYAFEVRAAEVREIQAAARPNPALLLAVEDALGTGAHRDLRQAQTTIQWSQVIELGGKRAARLAAAERASELARSDYELRRVEILAEATERFIHLVADQEELALAREATRLAEETLASVQSLVAAGRASVVEEKRSRVALARSRIAEEHAEHELLSARERLAAVWGESEPAFARAEARLLERRGVPDLVSLLARVERGPLLARGLGERALREAELALAESRRIADPIVGVGLRRLELSDDEAAVFQIEMPLPLFSRGEGEIAAARAQLERSGAERGADLARLRSVVFGLYQELKHADSELEVLEREIIPLAEEALAASRESHRQGRLSTFELADAQRSLLAARQELLTVAENYHRVLVELEKLLGEPAF